MTLPSNPIAIGRTAEVYAWEPGYVLKLYRDWCPPDWVDYEARVARAVEAAGVAAPRSGAIVEVNGRRGIVYERVDGSSMLDLMPKHLLSLVGYAQTLARLHLALHAARPSGLPDSRGKLAWAISNAEDLPQPLRERALAALAALPPGDRLLHGDFHPGNVLLAPRGPVVIDWVDAATGHPAADVARTRMLLSNSAPPPQPALRLLVAVARGLFYRSYLEAYRRADPETVRLSEEFLPVVAAARFKEGIAAERAGLLRMVERV